MSEDDKKLMTQYDITSDVKLIYSYKQHRYDNLKDAVNFAKLEFENGQASNADLPIKK